MEEKMILIRFVSASGLGLMALGFTAQGDSTET